MGTHVWAATLARQSEPGGPAGANRERFVASSES